MDGLQDSLEHYKESLVLRTDRDLYVVGEEVWMKVYKLDAHGNKADNFSKVVYIELLNQAGYPVNQLKLHVPDRSGIHGLTLSDTLSSGNYLLRAYTSWMKNYPAEDFAFRTISVINPFRTWKALERGRLNQRAGMGIPAPELRPTRDYSWISPLIPLAMVPGKGLRPYPGKRCIRQSGGSRSLGFHCQIRLSE